MNSQSPLVNPTALPLSEDAIATDKALIVAPHPDDETLGCGGAIALLRSKNCQVRVLVISDGTLSHPRSRKYPAPALLALREAETISALRLLGVEDSDVTFLRLLDGAVPTGEAKANELQDAIALCRKNLTAFAPDTIFLPWRHDPHPDHRATWQLIHAALADLPRSPRMIEYPIWDWDPEQRGNLPDQIRVKAWRLDISKVIELKKEAIKSYRSQTTNLIDDDPEGFRLTVEMLANFTRPWEVYIEEII